MAECNTVFQKRNISKQYIMQMQASDYFPSVASLQLGIKEW